MLFSLRYAKISFFSKVKIGLIISSDLKSIPAKPSRPVPLIILMRTVSAWSSLLWATAIFEWSSSLAMSLKNSYLSLLPASSAEILFSLAKSSMLALFTLTSSLSFLPVSMTRFSSLMAAFLCRWLRWARTILSLYSSFIWFNKYIKNWLSGPPLAPTIIESPKSISLYEFILSLNLVRIVIILFAIF